MDMVGVLVGTFEPARVMVAIAQANSASATTTTAPPSQPAGTAAGMNGKGMSQSSAKAAMTASAHASGGRMTTCAVAAGVTHGGASQDRKSRIERRVCHSLTVSCAPSRHGSRRTRDPSMLRETT